MLKAPRIRKGFKLYVAAQDHVIGAVLTQEDEGWLMLKQGIALLKNYV
jgi:hypothetical protein